MRLRFLSQFSLSIGAAFLLVGCGGAPAFGPAGPMEQNSGHHRAWMARNAKLENLLYVSGYAYEPSKLVGIVQVYDYNNGDTAGQLTGFETPVGQCTDQARDVYIVDQGVSGGPAYVYEYAHGGTEPIKTLYDSLYDNYALGCSVDPTTGNLALTDRINGILIYKNASGRPTAYTISGCSCVYYPPAYDSKGNVFAAYESSTSSATGVAELPRGGSSLTRLFLNFSLGPYPAAAQWDGKHLAVAGTEYQSGGVTTIYQVSVSGSVGTLLSTTILRDCVSACNLPFIYHKKENTLAKVLVGENYFSSGGAVEYWHYPAGGDPYFKPSYQIIDPDGASVSPN